MKNIEEIFDEWEQDSTISPHNLDGEALKISSLHHKYYRVLSQERMKLKKAEADLAILKKVKIDYYAGNLDLETLRTHGWKPSRIKVLKTDMNTYLDADEELIQSGFKIAMMKEKIEVLDAIIRVVGNRNFAIKSAIDFRKFQAGSF